MSNTDSGGTFKRKWWLHPMDPENIPGLSESDRRNAKSYNHWLLVWGILFFGINLSLDPLAGGINSTPVWRLLLVFSPIVPGIFLIRAFIRFFGETNDELIKKIHYGAIAVGFLFAFILGMIMSLLTVIIGPSAKSGPLMFAGMLLGYLISITINYRKYNA